MSLVSKSKFTVDYAIFMSDLLDTNLRNPIICVNLWFRQKKSERDDMHPAYENKPGGAG